MGESFSTLAHNTKTTHRANSDTQHTQSRAASATNTMGRVGNFKEYAAHAGCTKSYVTKLKQQGRLVIVRDAETGRDVVDFAATDRRVRETSNLGRAANGSNLKGDAPAQANDAVPAVSPRPAQDEVHDAYRKAQLEQRQLDLARSKRREGEETGKLIERQRAEQGAFEAYRELRNAVFAALKDAARQVVGVTELRTVELALEDSMRPAFAGWEARMQMRLDAARRGAA